MSAVRACVLLCLVVLVSCSLNRGKWRHQGPASHEFNTKVSVGLTIQNADWLQQTVAEVSNPSHPNWRKFVTQEELRQKISPPRENLLAVLSFLKAHGAQGLLPYPTGDFIMAEFEIEDVNDMLNIQLQEFRHADSGEIIYRSLTDYVLPEELEGLVDVFGMVSEFPEGHLSSRTSQKPLGDPVPMFNSVDNANRVSNLTCTGAPNFGYPASSDTDLYSQVQIICCNGATTKNLTSPCLDSNYPVLFEGFMPRVINNKTGNIFYSDYIPYQEVKDSCFLDGESITCYVPFTKHIQVQPYNLYNLEVELSYVTQDTTGISRPTTFQSALITSAFVTPQLFSQYYDIPLNYKGVAGANSQSVVEFGGQYYSPSDLTNFFSNMSLPNAPVTLMGYNDASVPGDEATLDIEWLMAVGNNIPTTFWSVSIGYLLEWTQQLLSSSNPPLVNSVSYAGNEMNSPLSYRNRVDSEFQKLAALGVSIVVASGDAGATDVGHGWDACTPFQPQYPSSSPFVTTVSATFFTPSAEPICSISYYGKQVHCSSLNMGEIAVSADNGMDWTTGGGFSNSVPRPSWQAAAVNGYLNQTAILPPASMFNASNRAYPDVSATGHNLLLILRDQMDIGDGTSAATPIFTAILALLNDWLLANNENPIGFANPLLYQIQANYPSAFYDVTVGGNRCGDVLHPPYIACCEYGYESSLGWDPVTGLGTPRFEGLLSALKDIVQQSKQ